LALLAACEKDELTGPEPKETPAVALQRTVAYKSVEGVEPNLLSLDLYYRSDTAVKRPVVVYVHGGGWTIGDKAQQIDNKVRLFDSLGYVFASVNYRLSPTSGDRAPDRVMYPIHNLDVADAVAWVLRNVHTYGGDPERVALLGHSAGAHLVSLTGTNPSFLEGAGMSLANLRGVAAIDTEGYDVVDAVAEGNNVYINAFGTDPAANRDASPIYNVQTEGDYPRFFIATRGSRRRVARATGFAEALREAGTEVTFIERNEYDHAGINRAIGAPGETFVTEPLVAFFESCFGI